MTEPNTIDRMKAGAAYALGVGLILSVAFWLDRWITGPAAPSPTNVEQLMLRMEAAIDRCEDEATQLPDSESAKAKQIWSLGVRIHSGLMRLELAMAGAGGELPDLTRLQGLVHQAEQLPEPPLAGNTNMHIEPKQNIR